MCIILALALQFGGGVSNHIVSAAFLAVIVSLAGGCAQLDGDEVNDDGTAIELPEATPERIWVDGKELVTGGGAQGPVATDACACRTADCFEAWVIDSFGCDVCVTFACEGEAVAHSCAACDEDPLDRGEAWSAEGRVE